MNFLHEQLDTNLGFTVDREVKELVVALNRIPGIRTTCSCQASASLRWRWVTFDATIETYLLFFERMLSDDSDIFVFHCCASGNGSVSCNLMISPLSYDDFVERLQEYWPPSRKD
jgi:hypothetical protein